MLKSEEIEEKKRLEEEITKLRKKLNELENLYYRKYLKDEGD